MFSLLVTLFCLVAPSSGNRAALLVVDVQDCFLSGGSLAVPGGNDVIPVINRMRDRHPELFAVTIFSKDWHCRDHVSFASQHPGHSPYDVVTLQYDADGNLCYGNTVPSTYAHARRCDHVAHNVTQTLWPDHCVKDVVAGAASSRLDPRIHDASGGIVLLKGNNCQVDSYSMFYDNGGFRQTNLHDMLQSKDVTTVYVVGLALDYCVYYTSLDAKKLGYTTYTVQDASRGVAESTSIRAVADLKTKGVHVIQSSDLDTISAASTSSPHILLHAMGILYLFSILT